MKKLLACLLLSALLFPLPLSGAVGEQPSETAWDNYKAHTVVTTQSAVELNIGVYFQPDASNPLLDAAFFAQYPNGAIVYHYLTLEQLSAYLLSGEASLDLLIVNGSTRDSYAKQNILEDLYQTDLLSAWPQEWIDIHEQMETDGGLYGMPRSVAVEYWSWYDTLADAMGIEKPGQIWTWDEFSSLVKNTLWDGDGDGQPDFYPLQGAWHVNGTVGFVDDFLRLYAYQEVKHGSRYSSDAFVKLLEMFRSIYLSHMLAPQVTPIFEDREAVLMTRMAADNDDLYVLENHSFLLPPTLFADAPRYVGRSSVFCLLRNAPQRDAALNYLRGALNADLLSICANVTTCLSQAAPIYYMVDQSEGPLGSFVPDARGEMSFTRTPKDTDFYLDLREEQAAWAETYDGLNFMRTHYLEDTGEWYSASIVMYEMLPNYLSGQLSAQQVTDAMDQRMALIQGE